MLSLRKHFGTAGLLVAVLALVAALGGSAVAANSGDGATASAKNRKGGGNVNKLIKRESRKFSKVFSQRFSKRFPGPIGPRGFPGLPGAPGEDGDDGDDGDKGDKGDKGDTGATGATGPEGPEGEEGSPWTAGGTLPSGETLTGTWAFSGQPSGTLAFAAASFPIPLAAAIPPGNTHVAPDAECPGTAADPQANAGHMCVFKGALTGAEFAGISTGGGFSSIFPPGQGSGPGVGGAGTSGAGLAFVVTEANASGYGTFAVTAP